MAHVSEAKKQTVAQFRKLIEEYPVVGALNMEGLPAKQLQSMREQLRSTCVIRMTKRRLLNIALEQAEGKKKSITELKKYLAGMPAMLFTKTNPFLLFKILKKNKSPAPAKGGQVAPFDITIPAGPTPFLPGPIISELGKFGLKTGVENGKVAIKQEKVVCKQGETISQELASLLTRLQIYPMEVGLDLTAVFEDGMIIPKSVLDIDENKYLSDLMSASQGAFNLAINAGIANKDTIEHLLMVAAGNATNLAVESVILNTTTADIILSRAAREMIALASRLPDNALSEELKSAVSSPEAVKAADSDEVTEKKEPDKPKKDDSENIGDAAAGLGALFG